VSVFLLSLGSVNPEMTDVTIPTALGLSVIGLCVVFIVLIILMAVIKLQSAVISGVKKRSDAKQNVSADASVPVIEAAPQPLAAGSCGEVSLHTVPDRTAAVLMAVTADKLGVPLNELRFISIREVQE